MKEGTNYLYAGKPEPLMIADKLVPGFEIFAKEMNEIRGPVVKEAVIEELVLSEELGRSFLHQSRKKLMIKKGNAISLFLFLIILLTYSMMTLTSQ